MLKTGNEVEVVITEELGRRVIILAPGFRHNLSIGILRVKQGFDYSKIIASEEVGTLFSVIC